MGVKIIKKKCQVKPKTSTIKKGRQFIGSSKGEPNHLWKITATKTVDKDGEQVTMIYTKCDETKQTRKYTYKQFLTLIHYVKAIYMLKA